MAVPRDYIHGDDGVASVADLRTDRARTLSGTLKLRLGCIAARGGNRTIAPRRCGKSHYNHTANRTTIARQIAPGRTGTKEDRRKTAAFVEKK